MLSMIFALVLLLFFIYFLSFLFVVDCFVEKIIIFFICTSAYIVLSLEIAGLFSIIDKPFLILIIQVAFTTIAYLLSRKKHIPLTELFPAGISKYVIPFVKQNPFLVFFMLFIIVAYSFLFFLSIYFPQNTTDALYNHLSRIGYWLQQGSLKPYSGFNNIGVIYPINNSLLMLWSIAFIRLDILVGSVQFISTAITMLVIFSFGKQLGFSSKKSLFAALIYLTFPIVLLESITAQNDALAACFISSAFLFLIEPNEKNPKINLVLSALAFSLALGTKQYALFIMPGYLLLFVVRLLQYKGDRYKILGIWTSMTLLLTIVLGSYSYIQNAIYFGNPFGETKDINYNAILSSENHITEKISINTKRLFSQFISCDGFPQMIEQKCSDAKVLILKPFFVNDKINIESDVYLLEQETPFRLANRYPLNEESAWYGALSWLLILPAIIYGTIYSLKRKRIDALALILISLFYFVFISSFKNGWDSYLGRYLIISVVLLMPFTAFFFGNKHIFNKIFLSLIGLTGIFITTYTIINNYSRPLIGKTQIYDANWEGSLLLKKIAYRSIPLIVNDKSLWGETRMFQRAYSDRAYLDPLEIVANNIPEEATLGIIAREGYFLDYLFFGESFSRKIYPIKNGDVNNQAYFSNINYLLVSPDYQEFIYPEFKQVDEKNGWRILIK